MGEFFFSDKFVLQKYSCVLNVKKTCNWKKQNGGGGGFIPPHITQHPAQKRKKGNKLRQNHKAKCLNKTKTMCVRYKIRWRSGKEHVNSNSSLLLFVHQPLLRRLIRKIKVPGDYNTVSTIAHDIVSYILDKARSEHIRSCTELIWMRVIQIDIICIGLYVLFAGIGSVKMYYPAVLRPVFINS